MSRLFVFFCALVAAIAPLFDTATAYSVVATPPEWPHQFEGRAIVPIAPSPDDKALARDFPGALQRFSDGRRQIVLRTINTPTRRLHQARDCFRANGHKITPAPMRVSPDGKAAACFIATRAGQSLKICEQIRGQNGESWPDVSSWYWPAALGTATGPWTAAMTVEVVQGK